MIDNQTLETWNDSRCIVIYRSGYDEHTHKGLDRYGKTDEYYKRTGRAEFIQSGFHLILDTEVRTMDDMRRFFGLPFNENDSFRRTNGWHLKVCFDHYGRLLLFKRDLDYEPTPFIKTSKTRTRTWTKWTPDGYQFRIHLREKKKENPVYTTWGWTFKRPEDFLVFQCTPWQINMLIPEHDCCSLSFDDAYCDKLWNTGITDLSTSWVTPESEAEVERIWRIRQQRKD